MTIGFLNSDRTSANWNSYIILTLVYSAGWIGLIANTEYVYWDGWVIFNQSPEVITKTFQEVGSPFLSELHNLLQTVGNGIWVYRLITFFSYLIVACCFLWVLRQFKAIGAVDAAFIAMFSAVYPVNQARISLVTLPYSITLATFLVAIVLMIVASRKSNALARLLSLILFAFSFITKSLLVFYLAPICMILYMEKQQWLDKSNYLTTLTNLMLWSIKHIDYLLLPIAFFIFSNIYFTQTGDYAGYNVILQSGIVNGFVGSLRSIANMSWLPIVRLVPDDGFRHYILFTILILFGLALLPSLYRLLSKREKLNPQLVLVALGFMLLFLALYPYHTVRKVPANLDWTTRHQLLFPFGCSIIFISYINIVFPESIRSTLKVIIVSLFILTLNSDMAWYWIDGVKQKTLTNLIAKEEGIYRAKNKIIVFDDRTPYLNAMNRFYRTYEYNGIMKRAFGDASRFGVPIYMLEKPSTNTANNSTRWTYLDVNDPNGNALSIAGTLVILPGEKLIDNVWRRSNYFFNTKFKNNSEANYRNKLIKTKFVKKNR